MKGLRTTTADRWQPDRGRRVDRLDRWLLAVVDAGLIAVVAVVPFIMGGRQALGQFTLVALAFLIAAVWMLRQGCRREAFWIPSPLGWILLAALALVSLQIIPLPAVVLHGLSPEVKSLLPLWSGGSGSLGTWTQLSLKPAETRDGLVTLVAYALLTLVATQRIGRLKDVERLLRVLAIATATMALFGLVQYLTSNGKFFWFYEHPFTNTDNWVRGSFTNRNHFAHFLAIGIGPLLWWAQKGMPVSRAGIGPGVNGTPRRSADWSTSGASRAFPHRFAVGWLLLAVTLFALLMSFSRGGALAMLAALGINVGVALRAGAVSKRLAASLACVALLVGASLAIHGHRSVAARLDDLASISLEELDAEQGRRRIWSATLDAFTDFPLLGAGVGVHRELYPRYFSEYCATEFTHAENGYLQLAEETGVAGLALLFTVMGLLAAWCLRTIVARLPRRQHAAMGAIAASLMASAVHACVDFVWYVPSLLALVALLAPCAFHLARWSSDTGAPLPQQVLPRPVWLAGSLAIAAVALACLGRLSGRVMAERHWDHFQISHRGVTDRRQSAELMLTTFDSVLRHDPLDARAHLAAAEAHLRHFDLLQLQSHNPMSLAALRDAATSSPLTSPQQRHAWLNRATGPAKPHLDRALWHTEQALSLCPLLGQGYVYLAELAFLKPQHELTPQACIEQALAVRPHDGAVLLKAGEESALAGDLSAAIHYWKQAFHADPAMQTQLIDYGAARGFPLSFFTEHCEPDLAGFRHLYARYGPIAPAEEFQRFRRAFADASQQAARAESGTAAATLWMEVHRLSCELGDWPRADQAVEQALLCDANHFDAHHALGLRLIERQRYEQAEVHLRWCQRRRPGDAKLAAEVAEATRRRIDSRTRSPLADSTLTARQQY